MIIDSDLDLLQQLVVVFDQQLKNISQKENEVKDPDMYGYYDIAEHITGLGFVACQTYMASVYGYLHLEKQKALTYGPIHSCGQTKVQIINHAANYWKHNNEWPLGKTNKKKQVIKETFTNIGFPVETDYPLSGILTEVVSPEYASFSTIIKILELWRNEIFDKYK